MIPRDDRFDSTLALLADPYRYVSRRGRALGTDAFAARLLLRPSVCMFGADAARLFYDERRFVRRGAAPRPLRKTLIGEGGVQGLDGAAHRRRKAMFVALTAPDRVQALAARFGEEWDREIRKWADRDGVVLIDVLPALITRTVCAWAGVPIGPAEEAKRSAQLRSMFDDAAAKGPRHVRARLARRRSEAWLARLVSDFRKGSVDVPRGCAFEAIACHQDANGLPLPARTAAVELLNLLRPTVAVAVYITVVAHALHRQPEERQRVAAGGAREARSFLQEVRRFYPFFPLQVERVRDALEWRGHRFAKGSQAVLDLYGTNHDPRLWDSPHAFRPERFDGWRHDPWTLVPQGGGDPADGHRCPGEGIALALMEVALDRLVRAMRYAVPAQDLELDLARLPALPRSGMVLADISAL